MNAIQAIRIYFEKDGGPKVSMEEIKKLSKDERHELGRLAASALGETFEAPSET